MNASLLLAWEICEFAETCPETRCAGRAERPGPLSCGLRRAFLVAQEGGVNEQ
ncbi:MAG TPA: hypothetical protein VMW83_00205 [Spirochaetia bacterium]|nr:hypothetical protein [Spirochaetia bacterium]